MKTMKFWRTALVATLVLTVMLSVTGGTIAWFTDEVTSANNVIKSGTLDVEMSWSNEQAGNYTDASTGAIFNYLLWEPGYTDVKYIKIENNGDLAFKYQIKVVPTVAKSGDEAYLGDVIDVYYKVVEADFTAPASAADVKAWNHVGNVTQTMTVEDTAVHGVMLDDQKELTVALALHMQESAGNEYQNKSVGDGFVVKLLATQYTHEEDSFNNQYDKDAPYLKVATVEELKEALDAGGKVQVTKPLEVTETLTVSGETEISFDGEGALDASQNNSRPFNLADGAKLTINAEGEEIEVGAFGLVNIPADVTNAEVTVNGGKFVGATDNGSFIKPRGAGNIVINLNNVEVVDKSTNGGWIVNGVDHKNGNLTVNVNGGTYTAFNGFSSAESLYINGATMTMALNAVNNSSSDFVTVVDQCDITTTMENVTDAMNKSAPSACVSASGNATITVKNSKLNGKQHATAVYTSGGNIKLENCEVTGNHAHYHDAYYAPRTFTTTIDGVNAVIVYPNCTDNCPGKYAH